MGQDINIKMTLTDGGSVEARVSDAKKLNKELDKTAETVERINKSQSAMPKSASAAVTRAGPSATEVTNYNANRGSAGAAGGTARDFAAQAQGLGGLVRLYATFAANIFAVTTAFNALRQAYNTEKMIQASERFSATVGTNLRSISKELQEATQYSLSFADSIKFTNVGTAAGLAAKDIKNLTVIAKGAATALGRDVGESIQRIIQGTAKQEQEILDELGIFIKSKKAFEEYAAARNMKADDLTATQRTLAYAEAVAKAGEKWKEFANIDDPFGRLTAELSNTLNQVLSVINKIAAPIAGFFADNTKAILALGLLITNNLVQKALPELKSAFLGALTFDNSRAKLNAELLRNTIGQELADISIKADTASKRLKELQAVTADISKADVRTNLAKTAVPKESLLKNNGLSGFSPAKLGAAFFDPKNIENIKTFEDSQKAVLGTVKEQLENEKTRAKILGDHIAKGNLDKASTYDKLMLSEQGNRVAAQMFSEQQKQLGKQQALTASAKEHLAYTQQLATTTERLNRVGGPLPPGSKPLAAPVVSSAAALATTQTAAQVVATNQLTDATTKANNAGRQLGQTVTNTAKSALGLKLAFAQISQNLEEARTSAAATGVWGQFKEAGTTVAGLGTNIAAVTAGTVGWGRATAAAGAIAATGLGAVRLALGGIMSALGPIMLAWTVWELAGDWIKETFFGINRELEKLKDNAKTAAKEVEDTFKIVNTALTRSNALLKDPMLSTEQVQKALEVRANALQSQLDALEKQKAQLNAVAAFSPSLAKGNGGKAVDIGADESKVIASAKERIKLAKELGLESAAVESLTASMSRLDKVMGNLDAPGALEEFVQLVKLLESANNSIEFTEALTQAIIKLQKEASEVQKITDGLKGLSEFVSGTGILAKAGAKAAGFGNDTNGVAAFKQWEKFKGSAKAFESASKEGKNLGTAAEEAAKSLSDIGKAAALMGIPLGALAPLMDKTNRLLEVNIRLTELKARIDDAVRKKDYANLALLEGEAATLGKEAARLSENLKSGLGTAETVGGLQSLMIALSKTSKTAAETQFSLDDKKEFKRLEQEINAAEAALKSMNSAVEVNQKLLGMRSNFTGQLNLENTLTKERVGILQQEYEIEAKKALLAREKVLRSRDAAKDPELALNARESYDNTLASLELTKQQKALGIDLANIERTRNEVLRTNEEAQKLAADAAERSLAILKSKVDLDKAYAEAAGIALGQTQEEVRLGALLLEQSQKRADASAKEASIRRDLAAQEAKINAQADAELKALARARKDAANLGKEAGPIARAQQAAEELRIAEQVADVEKAREAQLAKLKKITDDKLASDQEQRNNAEALLDIEERKAVLLAKQSVESQKLGKLTTAIVGAFKNTGLEKQAKGVSDILKMAQSNAQRLAKFDSEEVTRKQKNAKKLKDVEEMKVYGMMEFEEERANLLKDIAKEDVKASEQRKEMDVEATMESLSAFKGMFSEKTAAYKVLDGIERAMYVMRMAESAQQTAQMIADNAKQVASLIQTIAKDGVAAVLNQGKGDPYTAFARMAAMAAFVASLTGGSGGGKAPQPPAGMSAKDRQETQGTGMSWVNGQKVENGNGVFGDSTAKSESIKNSLELIAENTLEGLIYDNKMLKALEGLSNAITSTATSLFTVQGIRSGSAFGTQDISTKSSGIKGLFGSSTTKELVDSGIKITGMFNELAKGGGLFQQYETIQSTKNKSGFLGIGASSKVSYETKIKELDSTVSKSITDIFANATKLFTEVGLKTGSSVEATLSKLGALNVNFEASLKGLTGKELEDALNATISQALDAASNTLFGDKFKKFQQFGEGLLETVVRVVDSNDKVKLAFSSIGQTLYNFSFEASEALLTLVGGIEKFTDQMGFFRDNFLSETEKIAFTQQGVTKVMQELGYSSVDTRDEFKNLVMGIDVTTTSGQELYAALMDIAPAFATVTEAHTQLLEDYAASEAELLGLMRGNSKAKELLLERETAGMNAVTKAQFLRNRAIQDEIKATEEQISLMDELDSLTLSSAELRAKERAEISATNLLLYDVLDAYKSRKQAEEDMASAMQTMVSVVESLKSRVSSSAEAMKTAIEALVSGFLAAEKEVQSARQSLVAAQDSIVASYFAAKKGLDDAAQATATALNNIVKAYLEAQNNLKAARQAVTNAQDAIVASYFSASKNLQSAKAATASALNDIVRAYLDAKEPLNSARQAVANAQDAIVASYFSASRGLQAARAATASALNDIVSAYLDAKNGLKNAKESFASARGSLVDSFFGAKDGLEEAKRGTNSALENITKGYMDAEKSVEAARKQVQQAASNSKTASNALRNLSISIREFMQGLVTSDLSVLNPKDKVNALRQEFDSLYTRALGGDKVAAEKLESVASALLTASQETSSTVDEYSRTYGDVTSKLDSVATALYDLPDPDDKTDEAQTEALKVLADAQAELAKWQEALNTSGASKTLAEADLLEEWKKSKEAEKVANETFKSWTEAVSKALGFVPTEKEDPVALEIVKAVETFTKAQEELAKAEEAFRASESLANKAGLTDLALLKDSSLDIGKKMGDLYSAFKTASDNEATASADLVRWTAAVTAILGRVPEEEPDVVGAEIARALDTLTKAQDDLTKAEETFRAAESIATQAGLKDLALLKDSSLDIGKRMGDLYSAFTTAAANEATASADLVRWTAAVTAILGRVPEAEPDLVGAEIARALDTLAKAQENLAKAELEARQAEELATRAGLTDLSLLKDSSLDIAKKMGSLYDEFVKATAAENAAKVNLAGWTDAVVKAIGSIPTQQENKVPAEIARALDALTQAQNAVTKAEADFTIYKDALTSVGVNLNELSKYTDSTARKVEALVSDWTKARDENALASRLLLEAQEALGPIVLKQTDEMKEFYDALALYNQASAEYKRADDIIKNNSLENIRAAVAASQAAIVNAIAAARKSEEEEIAKRAPKTDLPDVPPPNVNIGPVDTGIGSGTNSGNVGGSGGTPLGRDMFDYNAEWLDYLQKNGYVNGYATGGDHLGGFRIVGERGAELEATGPSRIFNAEQTRKIMSGSGNDQLLSEVVSELRSVRAELAALRSSSSQVENNTRKAKDILEIVTQGGDTIKTETA